MAASLSTNEKHRTKTTHVHARPAAVLAGEAVHLGTTLLYCGGVIVYRQERCVFSNKPRSYAGIIRYEEAGQCICRLGRVAWF
jgi:hypothetical protein